MNPRLAAITGPLKGTVLNLSDDETYIGRETTCAVCLPDRSVSRRHSLIRREAGQFTLSDLESLNSTFVNDVPVKERPLAHGDRIRIGDSVFLFLTDEGEGAPAQEGSKVQFEEHTRVGGNTLEFRAEEAFRLMARDLNALMKVSTTISRIRGLEELQHKLLELIFEVVPAERGAILLKTDGAEEFTSVYGLDRVAGPDRAVSISRTVVQRVLTENVSVLGNDVQQNAEFAPAESVIEARVNSLLSVPLALHERVLGLIYLYTSDARSRFAEDHLHIVMAIAGVAAAALENARHIEWLENENRRLQADIQLEHNMIGESPRIREVYQLIKRLSQTDSTVLIRGESGTGKELAARAIHQNSARAAKPFVAVNCAALTETLLESELFGHEKGAFTGALAQKKGKLEMADSGTLFLDEVGEMSPLLQAKLLRVLQEREFERVGGTRLIKSNLRLIAATNRDLEEAITAGQFRADLYYRLNVVTLNLPALRERREDIHLLASYFAEKYAQKCNRRVLGISAEARARLAAYDWPGNVRELENAVERAVVLGTTPHILPEDLPEAILETGASAGGASQPSGSYHEAVAEVKKQLILKALEQAGGNFTEAAKLLSVHPNYLHRLVRNLDLKRLLH
jgi:Nif-specific regulatory protein